jgi:integrase
MATIPGKVRSLALVVKESGRRLTQSTLDGRFEKARLAAIAKAIAGNRAELVPEIHTFQFRDLRAKAGTDKEEVAGMAAAKDQLGHADEPMTRRYVRHRKREAGHANQVNDLRNK